MIIFHNQLLINISSIIIKNRDDTGNKKIQEIYLPSKITLLWTIPVKEAAAEIELFLEGIPKKVMI